MALETSNYITDLNSASPSGADPKSIMDDNLRLLKRVLKLAFPGFGGTILLGGIDTGAPDTYVLTPATELAAYSPNMVVIFKAANANGTATPTLNISGLGPKTIKAVDGSALVPGDIIANRYMAVVYDGTAFNLITTSKRYIDAADSALRTYIDNLVFTAALPNQAGKAGSVVFTDGTNPYWGAPLPQVLMFTTSTTWVATSTRAHLILVGGGGSSGTQTSNSASGGAGGGAAIITLEGLTIGATYTITIGAGGVAVNGSNLSGNAGGTSSFSGPGITTVTATGGNGGAPISASGVGGVGTGCNVSIPGGVAPLSTNATVGGASYLSGGGAPFANGVGYGAGAGGVYNTTVGTAGASGVAIIYH